jgi:hypothetical protein
MALDPGGAYSLDLSNHRLLLESTLDLIGKNWGFWTKTEFLHEKRSCTKTRDS